MDVRVQGAVPPGPFLGARDLLESTYDLAKPVRVRIRDDPDERTWAGHYDDHHVLNISRQAATSIMARELALHEYAHMHRYEEAHPSHTFKLEEAIYLGLAGRSVERRVLRQCHQLANHAKDIYADDITLAIGPTDKLVTFLESELAASVADNPRESLDGHRLTAGADPTMTAVNAAFAVALLERHDLLHADHRIYALAHAATEDAPAVDFDWFRTRFRTLARDTDESAYRRVLVDLVQAFVDAQDATTHPAAD